jgi:hypothetical protein
VKETCPVLGCMAPLPRGYLVCPDCWRCVPRDLKVELRAARGLQVGTAAWKCIEYVGAWKSPLVPEWRGPRWQVAA